MTVEDHPIPVKGSGKFASLKRVIRFTGTSESNQLWYRAATAGKLEETAQGQYRIDDVWTMDVEVSGPDRPIVRESAGKKELLIPIRLVDGKAEIAQKYIW